MKKCSTMSITQNKLSKFARDIYRLVPEKPPTNCSRRVNFLHICFNETEKRLIAVDSQGNAYFVELIYNTWHYRILGFIGLSTFVAFNPLNKFEIIVGLTSSEIQIIKFAGNSLENVYRLEGHKSPPTSVSFYKHYCLTVSQKEAIVWDLKSSTKIHQLQLERNKSRIKKALFSSSGIIVVLYENDTMQAWQFEQFHYEVRVCFCDHKLRNVKDFAFTKNGGALIICGEKKKIIVLETRSWKLLKSFTLPEKSRGARRLAVVPESLDTGANKLISILFEDGKIMFLDLNEACFVETPDHILTGVRKMFVSPRGQWIASILFDGSMIISEIDRLIRLQPEKVILQFGASCPKSHNVNEHLKYIEQALKDSLPVRRLIPILKQYGVYPERYRFIIWRMIMELPLDRKAFAALNNKIPINEIANYSINFQLADRPKASLLSSTVERLILLCPILKNCQYLPELIFPFIVVFQKDALLAFEASLMILWNFCQHWFEYHPLPPLNVLGMIENIMMEVDPLLLRFYTDHDVTSTHYAWPLLKTTLSEVFYSNEWLILWDHLLTYKKPWMLLIYVVAYNVCAKQTILSLLKSKEEIENYFGQPGQVDVRELMKVARLIDAELSEKNHPSQYFRKQYCTLPKSGSYLPVLILDYPKFAFENQQQLAELKRLKEEEAILIEKKREAVKIAEEKRLREESENFAKQVHQNRLRALNKCYMEEIQAVKLSLADKHKKSNYEFSSNPVELISPCKKSCANTSGESRSNSCWKLRNDVQNLVGEVQTFLKSIRKRR
ncbi:hypothetical protein PV327_009297 [Microctonus hyperodae]|uniref:Rab-GAP TBC domain-containing protein n=1 Tax=Microctonus hyperodae TaxID=165561 RepID=A0AA39KVR1_MICHY|nr:hypothetical protein PV327_009297 [Microctonus hyperodae]